jgi:hypothetical protein
MTKLILGVATCSFLLGVASCAKERVESVNDGKGALSFEAAMKKQKQTRATETTTANLIADATAQLDVYAYRMGETGLFNKFELKYDAGAAAWGYGTPVYQPGFLLRYYSVYPAQTGTPATNDYSFSYTVKTLASQQDDLIAASVAPTMNEVIALQYNHLLSQVNFAVQAIKDVKIVVGDITVDKLKNKATYTFSTGWGTREADSFTAYTYAPNATPLATLAGGQSSAVVALGDGGATMANALMLMPQTFDPANGGTDGTFSFTYTVVIDANNDNDFDDAEDITKTDTATVNFGDFPTATWAVGKRYLYVIDFTPLITGGPITFTVKVADWADADPSNPSSPTTEADTAQTIEVADVNEHSLKAAIGLLSEANEGKPALTVFPINVPAAIGSATTVKGIYGFDAADVIRIETESATSAANLLLSMPGWTRDVAATKVVTFSCTKPTVQFKTIQSANVENVTDDATLVTRINDAISLLGATVNANAYTEYTVIVGKDFKAAGSLITPAGDYGTGDTIRLVFPNTDANNAGITAPAGWNVTTDGAVVVLTKSAIS